MQAVVAAALPIASTRGHSAVVVEAARPGVSKLRLADLKPLAYATGLPEEPRAAHVQYILFHGKRHPVEMGAAEITRFLSSLAVQGNVAASTQKPRRKCRVYETEGRSPLSSDG